MDPNHATLHLQKLSKLKFHAKNNIIIIFAGSGELEFEEFCILAARFLIEEDEEQMRKELKEAFRFYDKAGMKFTCQLLISMHEVTISVWLTSIFFN